MVDDKKKSIAAMLVMGLKGKKKPGDSSSPDDMPSSDDESGEPADQEHAEDDMSDTDAAASEVMEALKSGDVAGFSEALKSFVQMCHYDSKE